MELKQVLETLKGHINDTTGEIKGLLDKQDAEIKKFGKTTEETGKAIDVATKRIDELGEELKAAQGRLDEMEKKAGRLLGGSGGEDVKSLGERFVTSEEFKNFRADSDRSSGTVNVKSFFRKTITGAALDDLPAYLYPGHRVPGIITPPERLERVRDLIPVLSTTQGSIEFIREDGFTSAADVVPEFLDDTSDESGWDHRYSEKPKSHIEFEIEAAPIRTIAHWLPVTRQILADAPGLQSYIDTRLLYGLKLVEDQQILYGTGRNDQMQGIITHPTVQTYDWSSGPAGDTKLDAIRRAMTLARVAEYPVTGLIMNPIDWEDIELLKGHDGHYLWINVVVGGQQMLWRVPVVDTTAINEGQFLTGAFQLGTALWDREQATIRVSDSHADFFTKNLLAILAEERLAQTIYRPEAFVVGTFDTAPGKVGPNTLKFLDIGGLDLAPDFRPWITGYSLKADEKKAKITAVPMDKEADVTILLNDNDVAPIDSGDEITWAEEDYNKVTIEVEPDGDGESKTYVVVVDTSEVNFA